MPQVNKLSTPAKLAAGAVVLAAAAFCINLIMSPSPPVQLDAQVVRTLSTSGAFKTVLGDGSRVIHVFLSTECVYCRRIEPELDRLENVTVYRHMLPGRSDAGRLAAIDVWCSKDPVKAWKDVAVGTPINSQARCDSTQIDKNRDAARQLGLTSTPSIVYEDGQVSAGMLSSGEIAQRIAQAATR